MTSILVTGAGQLVTNDPGIGDGSALGLFDDAAFAVENGRVAWVGPAAAAPTTDESIDVGGVAVVPGFVDSHSHLVFAGDRAEEFAARMEGRPYSAGGIRNTVAPPAPPPTRCSRPSPRGWWRRWPGRARRPWRSRAATV
jgi:imidazolonepropionase